MLARSFSLILSPQGLWWGAMMLRPSPEVHTKAFKCGYSLFSVPPLCPGVWFIRATCHLAVWKVMQLCFQILGQGKPVTQRELFYKLLCDSPNYFTSQDQVNRTVQGRICFLFFDFIYQGLSSWIWFVCFASLLKFVISNTDVVALLRCSRQSLGIMASSRGAIIGRLLLQVQFPKYENIIHRYSWQIFCAILSL